MKTKIEINESFIEANALVNTGYEAESCEMIIPAKLVEELNLWPKLPKDTEAVHYLTPAGKATFFKIGKGKIKIITPDKKTEFIETDIVISESEKEALISDTLTSELKIELISPGKGIWRFSDDPPKTLRESEEKQYWE